MAAPAKVPAAPTVERRTAAETAPRAEPMDRIQLISRPRASCVLLIGSIVGQPDRATKLALRGRQRHSSRVDGAALTHLSRAESRWMRGTPVNPGPGAARSPSVLHAWWSGDGVRRGQGGRHEPET